MTDPVLTRCDHSFCRWVLFLLLLHYCITFCQIFG